MIFVGKRPRSLLDLSGQCCLSNAQILVAIFVDHSLTVLHSYSDAIVQNIYPSAILDVRCAQ
jgi:hypothetical protein